jgi:hypothetical protein
MPRRFPLDGAFAELRQVVEEARDALIAFKASVGSASSSRSSGSSAGAAAGGANLGAAAAQTDRFAAAQERAARASKKLGEAVKGTDTAAAGLQKSLKGAADIAEVLGFKDAAKQLEGFAKGLGGVRDLVGGLVAAAPALKSLGIVAGAVGVAFGAVQEVIFQVTGKTVSLKNAVAILGLSIAGPLTKALAAASGELAGFASIASKGFQIVTDATRSVVDEFKRFSSVGNSIKLLPQVVKDAVPGLEAIGDAMAALAPGETVERVGRGFIELGNAVASAGRTGAVALKEIQRDLDAIDRGLDETIDQRLNEADQGPLFFRDPVGAVKKAFEDGKKAADDAIRALGLNATQQAGGPAQQQAVELGDATTLDNFRSGLLEAADLTTQTFDFIESAAGQFSATVSGAILDAFLDPQADIRDSFASLFKAIAQQLLQLLIQASILRIASGFAGFGAQNVTDSSGAVVGIGQSFARGGQVKNRRGGATLAHFRRGVRGLADGGPPPGIPASDTVPAWLTPGEFVEPVRAVKHYGAGFMEAIRTLSFPRDLAHAFAGVHVPAPVMTPAPRGYASGGPVAPGGGGGSGSAGAAVGVLAVDRVTARRIFDAGDGELERYLEKHQGRARKALGI